MAISEELRETLPYAIEEQVFLYLYKEKAVPVLTLTNIYRCDSLNPAKHPVSFLGTSCIRTRRLIRGVGASSAHTKQATNKQATNKPLAGHLVATPTLSSPLPHLSNFELN